MDTVESIFRELMELALLTDNRDPIGIYDELVDKDMIVSYPELRGELIEFWRTCRYEYPIYFPYLPSPLKQAQFNSRN